MDGPSAELRLLHDAVGDGRRRIGIQVVSQPEEADLAPTAVD